MPARQTTIIGAPCWVDLAMSDPERSRAFYAEVFGWTADEPNEDFGGYVNFRRAGVPVAGCMASPPGQGVADVWSVYLATDDAAKTLETAEANGGQVAVPAMPVGDLGTMAYVVDAGGGMVGVWQPGTFPGFGLEGEAGAPSWFELHTRDYEASVRFYRDVFGVESRALSESDDFRYTTLMEGETMLAGIMDASAFLPEGVPGHWSVYFGVDDTDAALARIVELGGSIVTPAEDTPYGRLATATDPMGARFKLVAPNESMPAR
ncbi:MAG TPA: VOC family protein [Acidimicrobiales bacterium]|nr:VOC family protein [Acidimicrobiales bacterium]